jgi:hypothetical protein
MAEQHGGATNYRYVAGAVMLAAWSVGALQLLGFRF